MARPKVLGNVKRRMVSLPEELSERVDDFRFQQRIRTESEAIRRLIEAGLGAIGTRGGSRSGGSAPGSTRKSARVSKPAAPRKAPERKTAPQSKLDQIRALRE